MNIREIIDNRKLTTLQYATLFICFLMNMLDGMDVLVISYTAPSISKEWGVSSEALGIVFSAGLLGMMLGAMLLAPKTDTIGRRPMILLCATLMGLAIFFTSFAQSVPQLVFFRILSGIGIGAMLASTPALASEYTPNRTKDFWVSFVVSGYPMGAFLSGLAAAHIIPAYGWRTMFQAAGLASLITLPLIYFLLSESLDFLIKKRPKNALKKINTILELMHAPALKALPKVQVVTAKATVVTLFGAEFKAATVKLWTAFFMSFVTLFFLTSWIPKLAVSTGLSLELAIYAGTVFNLGSFAGINSQGILSARFGLRRVIGFFLVAAALLMMIFGAMSGSAMILVLFGFIGFAIQGGFVGLYSVAARMYPTEMRTTGIGWAIGAGRLGAIVGPMMGGILIGAGLSVTLNFVIFAIPAIAAGIATVLIKSPEVT